MSVVEPSEPAPPANEVPLRGIGAHVGLIAAAAGSLLLAYTTIRGVLTATGGVPAVPLDDAYIHFQFARGFAELHPFAYSPGAPPVAGATSVLWPVALAPFWALGLRGASIIWAAWALSYAALALLAHDTTRLARRLVSDDTAIGAGALVLAFGGYAWSAGSGMEGVPFAWLLVRTARRSAELVEGGAGAPSWREVLALAWLTPLMRPEGALASLIAAGALALGLGGARRAIGLVALIGALAPALVYKVFTGSATSTTSAVKWLLTSPYGGGGRSTGQIWDNVRYLLQVLLDGEKHAWTFFPAGTGPVAWAALPAIVIAASQTKRWYRGGAVLIVALGMLIPTTYDSFLWNRLRYLWPFAAGWFIGVAAIAELVGEWCEAARPGLGRVRLLVVGAAAGALLGHLPYCTKDVAGSADAIRRQQVALGQWAADGLPASAIVGVNDTGAIAYFSGKRTFDVVGLTTASEAKYWVAGTGARFEHYERLSPEVRPTHFIVYRDWFGIPALFGDLLTERSVPGGTILGGETMQAHVADWSALGSGATPALETRAPRDELDVADLESESAHGYVLGDATQLRCIVLRSDDDRLDGARSTRRRERFTLQVEGGARLVARLGADEPVKLAVRVCDREVGAFTLEGERWEEVALTLPDVPAGTCDVEVRAPASTGSDDDRTFTAAHYWLYGR